MQILKRGDAKYQQVVVPWNGAVTSNPDEVLCCDSTHDVQLALARARQSNTAIALKAGGHSAAGFSSIQGGTLLSLRGLNAVTVDPEKKTVTVGGGALWGEVDSATSPHHLATPGCFISSVGVAGPLQSGGVSRLIRKHGLIADQLLSAEVVLADGTLIMASEHEHADLFWALRGGTGDFGVMTQMSLRLHDLQEIVAVTLVYPEAQISSVLREVVLRTQGSPRGLSWHAIVAAPPSGSLLPRELWGKPMLLLVLLDVSGAGTEQRLLHDLASLGTPSIKQATAISYSVLQKSTDEIAPAGKQWFMRAEWLRALDEDAIDAMIECILDAVHRSTSFDNQIILHQVDGDMADVSIDATPFAFRDAHYFVEIIGGTDSKLDADEQLRWCHATWERFTSWSAATGSPGCPSTATHLAHLGIGEDQKRVRGAFSHQTWQRLQAIKRRYDPTQLFSHIASIPTAEE